MAQKKKDPRIQDLNDGINFLLQKQREIVADNFGGPQDTAVQRLARFAIDVLRNEPPAMRIVRTVEKQGHPMSWRTMSGIAGTSESRMRQLNSKLNQVDGG